MKVFAITVAFKNARIRQFSPLVEDWFDNERRYFRFMDGGVLELNPDDVEFITFSSGISKEFDAEKIEREAHENRQAQEQMHKKSHRANRPEDWRIHEQFQEQAPFQPGRDPVHPRCPVHGR